MAWLSLDVSFDENCPLMRECHTLTAVGTKLFLIGGNDEALRIRDVYVFDTVTMVWSRHASAGQCPAPRSAHSATLVDNKHIYVFGGWDGSAELGELYVLDTETITWQRIEAGGTPPAARHFHNSCCVHRRLYIFGGFDGRFWRNDLCCLNVETNTWLAVQVNGPSPGVRASAASCVVGTDRLLVFGGYNGKEFLNDLWLLQIPDDATATTRWRRVRRRHGSGGTRTPLGRSGHTAVCVGNLAMCFGGRWAHGRFNETLVFCTETMRWHKPAIAGKLPCPRKTHAAALVGNRMFLYGGHDGRTWLADMQILEAGPLVKAYQRPMGIVPPASTLSTDFGKLINGSLSDVTFKVDGHSIGLHRAILAARSDFFNTLLTNGMSETSASTISIPDTDFESFMALARYLYTDELPTEDTALLPLLQLSQKWAVEDLSMRCQHALEARLSTAIVASVLDAADTHRAMPLRKACLHYIIRHFDEVSSTDGFLTLREDLLREILRSRANRHEKHDDLASADSVDEADPPTTEHSARQRHPPAAVAGSRAAGGPSADRATSQNAGALLPELQFRDRNLQLTEDPVDADEDDEDDDVDDGDRPFSRIEFEDDEEEDDRRSVIGSDDPFADNDSPVSAASVLRERTSEPAVRAAAGATAAAPPAAATPTAPASAAAAAAPTATVATTTTTATTAPSGRAEHATWWLAGAADATPVTAEPEASVHDGASIASREERAAPAAAAPGQTAPAAPLASPPAVATPLSGGASVTSGGAAAPHSSGGKRTRPRSPPITEAASPSPTSAERNSVSPTRRAKRSRGANRPPRSDASSTPDAPPDAGAPGSGKGGVVA